MLKHATFGFILLLMLSCASTSQNTVDYAFSREFNGDSLSPVAVFSHLEGEPEKDLSKVAYDAAALHLLKSGKIDVVDRAKVEEIIKEQELSYSGFVDQKEAVKLGGLLGARSVLFLDFLNMERDIDRYTVKLSAKLINVETGKILYVANASGSGWDAESAVQDAVGKALAPLMRK